MRTGRSWCIHMTQCLPRAVSQAFASGWGEARQARGGEEDLKRNGAGEARPLQDREVGNLGAVCSASTENHPYLAATWVSLVAVA